MEHSPLTQKTHTARKAGMSAGFTPGPHSVEAIGRRPLMRAVHATALSPTGERLADFRHVADANLFAAAPELYEALERYRKAMDAKRDWPENDSTKRFDAMLFECELAEAAADAALAKARGDA